jgi:hypothetical protein
MRIDKLGIHTRNGHPFYKGSTEHGGQKLVFFGWSRGHVIRKENEWLAANADRLNQKQHGRPALRLVVDNGSRG